MNAADPLHQTVGAGVRYSRINNAEVLPGIMTAASWSFWDDPVERAFRRALYDLGIGRARDLTPPAGLAHRLRAVFHGRIATNMSHHGAVGALMPGFLRTAFIVHLFAGEAAGAPVQRRRLAWVLAMPWLILRLPSRLRTAHHDALAWWRDATGPRVTEASLPEAIAALDKAHAQFERAMTLNITASLLSSAPVQQIVARAKQAGRPDLAPAVIAGYGTQEALMAQRLSAIADGSETISTFLADFGFHGQAEGQLHRISWRESPEQVRTRAASLREGTTRGRSPETVRAAQRAAERDLLQAAGPASTLRLALRLARRLAPLRELTKACYLMTIDAGRCALRRIGRLAAADGLLATPDDIMHLTIAEILAGPAPGWATLAEARRTQFEARQSLDIPEHFSGVPNAVPIATAGEDCASTSPQGISLQGLGVSAGTAEGPARVLREIDGVDDLQDGEVLVCRSTDPSWTPAFMIASAAVIDIGSLLSHGAIVARELGLPCVVGTGSATSSINTGDTVRVDGSSGVVEITRRKQGLLS